MQMLQVSETAKTKFQEFLAEEQKDNAHIRIYVSGMGWGGPRYGLTLDESVQEDKDVVEEAEGIKFVYEKSIAYFLDGKSIDYQDGPRGGFSINSGEPGNSCGDCSC